MNDRFTLRASTLAPEDVPGLLLPYQQRWIADRSKVKLCTKSRRIGLSWAEASDCALSAAEREGESTYYIGYDKDMARGFISDAADWAKAYQLTASEIDESEEIFRDGDESKSILIFRIYFNSGHRIEALSSSPRNFRSRQGRVVIDEAAFHDDLFALLKAAKALMIWGGRINIITTYNGMDNAYYDLEQEVLEGKLPYSRHFITFENALAEGLYRRMCLHWKRPWSLEAEAIWRQEIFNLFGEDAEEELLCIPKKSGGAYLSGVLIESCMEQGLPVLRLSYEDEFATLPDRRRQLTTQAWIEEWLHPLLLQLNPNLRSFFGQDFARSGDLSYILPAQELPDLRRFCPFGLELRNVPFQQQEQVLFALIDGLPRFTHGALDSRGNGQYQAERAMQKCGIAYISQIALSNPFYGEWFPRYKTGLQDGKVVLPADADLKADHRLVEQISGIPKLPETKIKGADGEKRHGDGAVAGLLMWYASCQEGSPIEFQALGQPRASLQSFADDRDPITEFRNGNGAGFGSVGRSIDWRGWN